MRWDWMDWCDLGRYAEILMIVAGANKAALSVRKPVHMPESE